MSDMAFRIEAVRARIRAAAQAAGRDPAGIRLVGVSKTHPVEAVHAAFAAGLVDFGENRVQELVPKMEAGPPGAVWHMIGTLQTNKIRHLAGRVDWIHSVPGAAALHEISKRAVAHGRTIRVLLQVNISGEGTKSGCEPDELPALVAAAAGLPGVDLRGLMGMAAPADDPETVRPQFALLRQLRDRHLSPAHELSMGMSHDLEAAIAEGATMVRVGTAIFGERDYLQT